MLSGALQRFAVGDVGTMAGRKTSQQKRNDGDKYSVLLPTYNERENLPLIVWLLVKYFGERWSRRFFILFFPREKLLG